MSDIILDTYMLHYALKDRKYMLEITKSFKPEHFNERFQTLFDVLFTNFNDKAIDTVLSKEAILDYCQEKNHLAEMPFIKKAYDKAGTINLSDGDFKYYVSKVKTRYNKKIVEEMTKEISKGLSSGQSAADLNSTLDKYYRDIHAINAVEIFDEGTIADDIDSLLDEYTKIEEDPLSFRGIFTGIDALDNITNGLHPEELIIIGGMESTGKSLLMMNMAVNAWLGSNKPGHKKFSENGHNILYFTLEMPRSNRGKIGTAAYLNKRIFSCVSELPFSKIRKGELDNGEKIKLKETADFIKHYSSDSGKNFYVVDIPRGATVNDIEVKYLELKDQYDIDLVVIDYIGIMKGVEGDSDHEVQGHIAEGLHEMARKYQIPVLTAVQVNRPQGTSQSLDKQNYNNTRIARSARISQNANIVLQIGSRDEEETYTDMPIYITKMRDGTKGKFTLEKAFDRMRVYNATGMTEAANLSVFEELEVIEIDEQDQNDTEESVKDDVNNTGNNEEEEFDFDFG